MYICQVSGKLSEFGEKLNKIVVASREKVYFERRLNEDLRKYETVEVGRGTEVVKEINASDEGVTTWNLMSSDERLALLSSL
tara:strand:+ start:1364 stop:1609 length:246 start_codon:yes stop_codon:yes gene_type:complete